MRLHHRLAIVFRSLFGTLLGILLFLPIATQSQQTATITGTLTDPSGAAIQGARVSAQSLDSPNAPPKETSGAADGKFALTLVPGRYRVSVQHPSFTGTEAEFTLAAGDTRVWDVRLELEPMSADVVVSASAEPATIENTAALVNIVTREQIDQRGEIWLTPLTQGIPGISFSQLGPMGGSTTFFLDGGNSDYTKVLIDGVPVNQPGGLVDFSNFSLDGIDKIEVVHGAASVLYGSDAMTGVLQIFTHRGTTSHPVLELAADGGTFGTGHGTGQLSGLAGAFDYSAGAAYFSSDGQGPDNFFRDTTLK